MNKPHGIPSDSIATAVEEGAHDADREHHMNPITRTCPLCGQPNDCQPAKTGFQKEPCWCTQETFPPELLTRVPEDARRTVCICRRCVVAARRAEAKTRPLPNAHTGDFYTDDGRVIFTEQYHRKRGYCCGNGCRHCPFDDLERDIAFAEAGETKK